MTKAKGRVGKSIKTSVNPRSRMQKRKPVVKPRVVAGGRGRGRGGRGRGGGRGGGGRGGGGRGGIPAGYVGWAVNQGIIGGDY